MGWFKKLIGLEAEAHAVVALTEDNFAREVLQSPVPVLVDAWSQGCGPCKLLEPVVMQLSREYQGRLKVAEFDVALAPKIAARLRVTGTPTVVYFSGGREVERVVGYRASHYHRALIDQELLNPLRS
ncbi:MAG: thioredoxin domain-containing protein [Archangium sp.]|nr:thioredoxin domain-containing protein [Archangium sp.]MDP3575556.1 thioredoxin domain-containing protein [Archangium sp.]